MDQLSFDLVLTGATILDGIQSEPFQADIGVQRGVITALGDLSNSIAKDVRNVQGLHCAPGFIDAHTHSDLASLLSPDHDAVRFGNVRQGVTTEIAGNCGFSAFPVADDPEGLILNSLRAIFGPIAETHVSYDSLATTVVSAGLVNNVGFLVGHGTLRATSVGHENRRADPVELKSMQMQLDLALESGALGLSTGLVYPPGMFAPFDEVAALAEQAVTGGRLHASHIRNELDGVETALRESLAIARESGGRIHISHLKAAGRRNWGRTESLLETLEAGLQDGIEVSADMYPYTAGSTVLFSLFPPWTNGGSLADFLQLISETEIRVRIDSEIKTGLKGWQNMIGGVGWDNVIVASAQNHGEAEGRSIGSLSEESGQRPIDAACDLLLEEAGEVLVLVEMMSQDDVDRVLRWPRTVVGSDGIPVPGKPHPRWSGSFTKFLGHYGAARLGLSLGERIRRVTSLPARHFRLSDRGVIGVGKAADLVVFDPTRLASNATYSSPLAPPGGIEVVVVNGTFVIDGGAPTSSRPGQVVRSS